VAFGLIGAGIGLLLSGRRRKSLYYTTGSFGESESGTNSKYYEGQQYESDASGYTKDISQAAAGIRNKAAGAAATAVSQARKAGQHVRNTAQNAGGQAASAFDSNPLLLGVAALVAGAVVGLAIPSTQLEGEYLGETSEQVINRAKSAARDTADRAQRAAQDTGRELKQKAKQAIGLAEAERQREPQPATY
jgi:hypothetical protein